MRLVSLLNEDADGCIEDFNNNMAGEFSATSDRPPQGAIALIDDLSLRRAGVLKLLRGLMRDVVEAFTSVDEFFDRTRAVAQAIGCVILNVGSRSLHDPLMASVLLQLGGADCTAPLVVLSDLEDAAEVVAAFRHGARGFIPSSTEPLVAVAALRLVQAGTAFFPASALAWRGQDRPCEDRGPATRQFGRPATRWPPRQLAVLRLLGEGLANKEIARALGSQESTVKVHVWHIMRRLDVPNRTQAVLRARELGIIGDDAAL